MFIIDPYKPPTLPDIIDLTEDAQNTVFTSNVAERNSFIAKTSIDDDDIQIVSSKSKNGIFAILYLCLFFLTADYFGFRF